MAQTIFRSADACAACPARQAPMQQPGCSCGGRRRQHCMVLVREPRETSTHAAIKGLWTHVCPPADNAESESRRPLDPLQAIANWPSWRASRELHLVPPVNGMKRPIYHVLPPCLSISCRFFQYSSHAEQCSTHRGGSCSYQPLDIRSCSALVVRLIAHSRNISSLSQVNTSHC